MQDWQLRVMQERAELRGKIMRLDVFLTNSHSVLRAAEHGRMVRQLRVMREYESILTERIEAFEVADG